MHRPPTRALLAPQRIGWGVLAIAIALSGAAIAVLLLDSPGGTHAVAARLATDIAGGDVDATTLVLGIGGVAAVVGALLGTPLGLAVRRPRRLSALALRVLTVLPLAVSPLALALGLERLVEAGTWRDALPAASALGDTSLATLVLAVAHLPAAIAIVAYIVRAAGTSTDTATLEAARLLGAGRIRRFVAFELPTALSLAPVCLALAFLLVATSLAATLSLVTGAGS